MLLFITANAKTHADRRGHRTEKKDIVLPLREKSGQLIRPRDKTSAQASNREIILGCIRLRFQYRKTITNNATLNNPEKTIRSTHT